VSDAGANAARPGKRQFLVHIDASLIRRIKVLAIDRNVSASSLVQEALLAYLPPATDGQTAASALKAGDQP
jgi:ribbon-helix-helix CopG family protein